MIYRNLLENLVLPLGDAALGTSVSRQFWRWQELQWASPQTLHDLQRHQLANLLSHAKRHVPHYRSLDVSPTDDPYETLKRLPILTKHTLKEHGTQLVADAPNRTPLITSRSSGSSGIQSTVYFDRHEESIHRAIQLLWWTWSGWKIGDSIFQTGITPHRGWVKGLKDRLFRTRYVNAFRTSEDEILRHLGELQRHPRHLLAGYPSSLYLYARTALEQGYRVRFSQAVSWGDKLFPSYRTAIQEAFGTSVHDTYGCSEGFLIAAQCNHRNYHIMTPHIVLELLDATGREVAPGQMGRVVVTGLDTYRMPLMRYEIGDLATRVAHEETCPCGRALPGLGLIVGRDTDIVQTPDHHFLIVHYFTGIFEFFPQVRQFQVLQEQREGITIRYIPDEGCTETVLAEIRRRLLEPIRGPFSIHFEPTDQIPPSPSGKPQIILSRLKCDTALQAGPGPVTSEMGTTGGFTR